MTFEKPVRIDLLSLSLAAALGFFLVKDGGITDFWRIAIKGASVGFLAAYAWHSGHRVIAAVLALGALGDILIELRLEAGAAAFLLGHIVATGFYWHRRRSPLTFSQSAAGLALLVLIPAISFLLPADRSTAPGIALYAAGLAAMTATAWTSSFSRYRVGLGAVLFAVSDLLIFARFGPLESSNVPGILIWPLYYLGQLLICIGVTGGIRLSTTPDLRKPQ